MASAPSGSTPITLHPGFALFSQAAIPLNSPPPPTGTSTASTSGQSCMISRPTVPWPAITSKSSNGGTMVSFRLLAMLSAFFRRSSEVRPLRITSAPIRRAPSTLMGGAFSGMTTTAGTSKKRAARATAWAWLPEL